MADKIKRVFSKDFIEKYKRVLIDTFGYEAYGDFLTVKSFLGKKTLVYLPLIHYCDIEYKDIDLMISKIGDMNYQIRSLNFEDTDIKEYNPVTMRLYIDKTKPLERHYKRQNRRYIKWISQEPYTIKEGYEYIDDFYKLIVDNYHRHGTPLLPKLFFENLYKIFGDDFHLFVILHQNSIVATGLVFKDENMAWYAWSGMNTDYLEKHVGHAIYHCVTREMIEKYDIDIFDFGRSPYKVGTYYFKRSFGAEVVKIETTTPQENEFYQKYGLLSKVYKKIPYFITDKLGTYLTTHLPDR